MASNISSLFEATSIAIVGVSTDTTKIGSVVLHNLMSAGYKGKIYPVNPKYQEIEGLKCYPKVTAIAEPVDVVCIAIPAPFVKGVITEIVEKGANAVVIITAGFGEVGEEGKAAEKELTTLLSAKGIRLLGPNCLGFMSVHEGINVTFAATYPEAGNIAIFSQSGAICTALLDTASAEHVGFSHVVSIGNKADISEVDLLPYFMQHPNVKVIGAYLENIDFGKKLVDEYIANGAKKPFVVIKPGITQQAVHAIKSHTGAVASSEKAYQVSLQQHGIVQISSITDFYALMKTFSWLPERKGKNAVIVTNAGGPGIMATDEVVLSGLVLYQLSEEMKQELKAVLPPEASVRNPIDLLGDALADRYTAALNILEKDEQLDVIFILISPQFVTNIPDITNAIREHTKVSKKMVVPIYLGKKVVTQGITMCEESHIPAFASLSRAVRIIDIVTDYYHFKGNVLTGPTLWENAQQPFPNKGAGVLPTEEVSRLLQQYGIHSVEQAIVHSVDDAVVWAQKRYPVVLKIPNEILAHKTEEKGVYLHLSTEEKLRSAWEILKTKAPYLLIQAQVSYEAELFLGAHRDGDGTRGFGHMLVYGQGGIYAEIQKDFGYAMIPASRNTILEQLSKTRVSNILVGARNKPPLAVAKYVELIERMQQLLIDNPHIQSIDINPVLVTETEVFPADVKIYY